MAEDERAWVDIEVDDETRALMYEHGWIEPVVVWQTTPEGEEMLLTLAESSSEEEETRPVHVQVGPHYVAADSIVGVKHDTNGFGTETTTVEFWPGGEVAVEDPGREVFGEILGLMNAR